MRRNFGQADGRSPRVKDREKYRHEYARTDPRTARSQRYEDRHAGGRRLGRPAAGAGGQDRTGNRPHAESRRSWPAAASRGAAFRSSRASRPAAGRGTWDCSATIRWNTASAAGRWKPRASASSWARTTWPHAAISARSTPPAKSATAAPAASSERRSAPLAMRLRQVKIPGVEVFVEPVKEHRFVVVFRGAGPGRRRARYRSAGHGRAAAAAQGQQAGQRADGRSGRRIRRPGPEAAWPAKRKPTA